MNYYGNFEKKKSKSLFYTNILDELSYTIFTILTHQFYDDTSSLFEH